METTARFENIPQEIARRLAAATQEIVVAVAWFTDRDLFDVLCKQAGRDLRVRLAVLDDRINVGPGRVNFPRLQDVGGEVFLIPAGGDRDPIMHHKFCVIDRATVIIGSYNWTLRAQDNDESITVIADGPEIAADYLNAFDALLCKHGLSTPAIDNAQVRRRLEIVRNLLLLDDWETLAPQLDKIRPAGAALRLEPPAQSPARPGQRHSGSLDRRLPQTRHGPDHRHGPGDRLPAPHPARPGISGHRPVRRQGRDRAADPCLLPALQPRDRRPDHPLSGTARRETPPPGRRRARCPTGSRQHPRRLPGIPRRQREHPRHPGAPATPA